MPDYGEPTWMYDEIDAAFSTPIYIFNNTQPNTICHTCGSNNPRRGELMCIDCIRDFTPAEELPALSHKVNLRATDIARFHRWKHEQAHGKGKK